MYRPPRIALWLVLLAMTALPAQASAPGKSSRKPAKKAAAQPAQTQAPRPPKPEELPPQPPTVIYRGGLLTIVAQNSTLSDVLSAVRKATGANVDAPASATERVATRLGPGQPRDVLTELLNGSRFDYVLLSPAENPGGVRRLILAPRSGEGASSASVSSQIPSGAPSAPVVAPGGRALPPDTEEDVPEQTVEPAEEAPPETEPEPQPAPPQPPQVKTPEQLQEELRRHEEEQRIQQQQQPPEQQPPE